MSIVAEPFVSHLGRYILSSGGVYISSTALDSTTNALDVSEKTKILPVQVNSNLSTSAAHTGYDFMEQFTVSSAASRAGGTFWIQDLMILVKENRAVDFELHFFNTQPTVDSAKGSQIEIDHTHYLDGKYMGFVRVGTGSYAITGLAGSELSRIAHPIQQSIPLYAASGDTNLYVVAKYMGASWTPSSATLLQYQFKILQT